jgi:hypothetical protein
VTAPCNKEPAHSLEFLLLKTIFISYNKALYKKIAIKKMFFFDGREEKIINIPKISHLQVNNSSFFNVFPLIITTFVYDLF